MMRLLVTLIFGLTLLELMQCRVIINSTSLATARTAVSGIQAGNKILFAGGFEFDDQVPSDTIDIFNMADNEWLNTTEKMPHPRGNIAPVVLGNHIYFIGGNEFTNKPYIFTTIDNNFNRTKGDPPSIRQTKQISLHTDVLTVIGTWNVDLYYASNNTWSTADGLRSILKSLQDPIVITAENYVFILGGANSSDPTQISNLLHVFNTETRNITTHSVEDGNFNATTNREFFSHFNNHVLFVQVKNSSTLLYHVLDDTIVIMTVPPITFVTTTSRVTHMFYTAQDGMCLYDWPVNNKTSCFEPPNRATYAFGFGEYVGYFYKSTAVESQLPVIYVKPAFEDSFLQVLYDPLYNLLDWYAKVIGYDWLPHRHVISDGNSITVVDMDLLSIASFAFTEIRKIFVSDGLLFVFTEPVLGDCIFTIEAAGTNYNITKYPCVDQPDLMLGQKFVYIELGLVIQWPENTVVTTFPPVKMERTLTAQDSNVLYAMQTSPEMVLSGIIDIYDLVNGTWLDSIEMPPSVIGDRNDNIVATAFNDVALTWFNDQRFEISSPEQYRLLPVDERTSKNFVLGNPFDYPVHSQLSVVDGNNVYLKSFNVARSLRIYNRETGLWNSTKAFPDLTAVEPLQLFLYNRVIYMIARKNSDGTFEHVYFYNIDTNDWQITRYPIPVQHATAALVGDYLALIAGDGRLYSLHLPSGVWIDEFLFDKAQTFSTVILTNSNSLVFVAGAQSLANNRYATTVLVLTDDGVLPAIPVAPTSNNPKDDQQTSVDSNTLVIAIVVPIGAVLIAGALLAFFLIRRNKKRRGRGASSVIGLETKYGQWFTPFEQIKFGEQLGQGGNGQVFKGTWKNTTVALKVSMTQANSTVIAELELMMQMRPHPNVVQLFGFSLHPETDSIILIIEYCDQGSLDTTLFDDTRHISAEQKLKWIAGAAQGLAHLHSNNIVHRDVAARNVLLHQNEPKITDFGMSRLVEEGNQKGTTKSELGPIRWMAPEALKSKEYSTKSDVWSFAILMFEIIAQQEPHSAADPIEVGRQIRDNALTPTIPESCPTTISTIMRQCWNINPNSRPTVDQILHQIEN